MPICLKPDKPFPIVLDSDKDDPTETRHSFLAKTQSMDGQLEIFDLLDELRANPTTVRELFDKTVAKLGEVLSDWKNFDLPFSVENLRKRISYHDARELLTKCAYNIEAEEKKD